MTESTVAVGSFDNEVSAALAREMLEANGIPAQVLASGGYSYMRGRTPIRLAVRAEDAPAALRLLRSFGEPSSA